MSVRTYVIVAAEIWLSETRMLEIEVLAASGQVVVAFTEAMASAVV